MLAFGSPAIFGADTKFIRVGRNDDDVSGNRRADAEIKADVAPVLRQLTNRDIAPSNPDRSWYKEITQRNAERKEGLVNKIRQLPSHDGIHPYSLIDAVNAHVDEETIAVIDGGDILSFARVAISDAAALLDPGALGCIGVGGAFANAAALCQPDKKVVAVIGDGSFGFNAMEIHTSSRKDAKVVMVIANNSGWNIDKHDQIENYNGNLVGVELGSCRYDQIATAVGAYGERVEKIEDLPGALERAFKNAPALLDVVVDPTPQSPDFLSGMAYVHDLQVLGRWHEQEVNWRAE